jgi:CBS domain-containing membrane protein
MLKKPTIRVGATYSNGDFGVHWAVRQVLKIENEAGVPDSSGETVHFKVLVGPNRRKQFHCSRDEFSKWVKYEVLRNENSWERVDSPN